MCLCFSGRFDHVTSYFDFSCNDFARLLCAGKRLVAYNNFALIPAPFTRELNVSRRMYQVKLFQNGPVPLV